MTPELVFDSHDCCGESPRWDARRGRLWWIDNERATVHCHTHATGDTKTLRLPRDVSSLALTDAGLVATMSDGVYQLSDDSSSIERIVEIDPGDAAFNDSGCDARGRLWLGSGSETVTAAGRLWVLPPGAAVATPVLDGLSLSNGIGFSPDNRFMYLADSLAHAVYRFAYDLEAGTLGEREVFCASRAPDELPDGLAVDVDGGVWVAFWDGGCVRRYAADGSLQRELALPVRRVTACAFGGPELSDLYVTTASYGLSDEELAAQPLAGALFRFATETEGVPIGRIPVPADSA